SCPAGQEGLDYCCARLVASATAAAAAPAIATAATAAAAIAAAATAAAATTTFGARTSLVDRQGPAVNLLPIQGCNRGRRILVVGHLHKAEALGATRVPIHDNLRRRHFAVRLEQLP